MVREVSKRGILIDLNDDDLLGEMIDLEAI
jgi:hypothetical protein